ncbi:hypothetical protein ACH41E_22545 [Streptomyces sp. NPDC020412]|uniref:hypothetical protein n=1 Tax=Streptomyces sp. NPDC020412 TaxID=3365073 RepID=UPI0037B1104A
MSTSTTLKRSAAVALSAAALAVTVGASPAAAATSSSARAAAPTCVAGWVDRGTIAQTGHARNDCSYRVRVKIVWAFGADGSCHTLNPGGHATSKVAIEPRRFDGIKNC